MHYEQPRFKLTDLPIRGISGFIAKENPYELTCRVGRLNR